MSEATRVDRVGHVDSLRLIRVGTTEKDCEQEIRVGKSMAGFGAHMPPPQMPSVGRLVIESLEPTYSGSYFGSLMRVQRFVLICSLSPLLGRQLGIETLYDLLNDNLPNHKLLVPTNVGRNDVTKSF